MNALSLLALTLLSTQAPMPTVAVMPPATEQKNAEWFGLALADDLATRLLRHSLFDSVNVKRTFPVSVFDWRQCLEAAREAGINPKSPLSLRSARRIGRLLGTDYVLVGVYWVKSRSVRLTWRLAGLAGATKHTIEIPQDQVAEGVEQIFIQMLSDLGLDGERIPDHSLRAVSPDAYRNYGRALHILSDQSIDPRAHIWLRRVRLLEARRLLHAATRHAPRFSRAWAQRAIVATMLKESGAAEATLAEAMTTGVQTSPEAAMALYYYYWKDREAPTDAIDALRGATERHRGFLRGLGYLGQAYLRVNKPAEALEVFERYTKRAPDNPWVLVRRAEALSRLAEHDKAVKQMQALHAKFPDVQLVVGALAKRQADSGDLEAARITLRNALTKWRSDPVLLTQLSYLSLAVGTPGVALPLAQKAARLVEERHPRGLAGYAHINLGHVLVRMGRKSEAYAAFRKAEQLGIDDHERIMVSRDPHMQPILADPACPLVSQKVASP